MFLLHVWSLRRNDKVIEISLQVSVYQDLTFIFLYLGVSDYVTTEISTSKQKKFNLVMFVDTPGLVDGDMLYPFDVNKSIEFLGE